jgi:hypothetical protein
MRVTQELDQKIRLTVAELPVIYSGSSPHENQQGKEGQHRVNTFLEDQGKK